MSWLLLWKFALVFTLVVYTALVIIVFFGGVKNIFEMFEDLKTPGDNQEAQ